MKIQFVKYLHDDLTVDENVEHLSELPDDDARRVAAHRPWYEVGLRYEYDTATHELTFIGLKET